MDRKYIKMTTPIDDLFIVSQNKQVAAIYIGKEDFLHQENVQALVFNEKDPLLLKAKQQINEYFSRLRTNFDLPLLIEGTPFQRSVWKQLMKIPYGKTVSYQEIAKSIGNEKAVRAVGQANKSNKLPIVIPCHRVIGKNKSLTGYAGKRIHVKKQLLLLEGVDI